MDTNNKALFAIGSSELLIIDIRETIANVVLCQDLVQIKRSSFFLTYFNLPKDQHQSVLSQTFI